MNPRSTEDQLPVSVGFFSLGCAKNLVDSQIIAGNLLSDGIVLAASPETADIVIVNTCSFIEDAREESIDTILTACDLKKKGSCRGVLVAGCMPQRYSEEMSDSFPEVDAFIGLDDLEDASKIIRRIYNGESGVINVSRKANKLYEPKIAELVFTGGPYAYIKIAEGCNHKCAFCAIPGIRGKYRSRPIKEICKEAETLLESGIKEINLISQDLTNYGSDLKNKKNLPLLIQELDKIGGDFWIRLLYGYPAGVSESLLTVMAESPRVCKYLDIPIQHSHPEILRSMTRSNTIKPLSNIWERARSFMPEITLRTTCLTGFPGESEEHSRHLLNYIKDVEFDHMGSFVYSKEENTKAFDISPAVSRRKAEQRREQLMLAQRKIVDRKNAALVDSNAVVLIEGVKDSKTMIGRSQGQAPEVDSVVYVKGSRKEDIGNYISVRYTSSQDYDLIARKANEQESNNGT